MLKTLKSFDLKDKRVLIRVDFNVPVDNDCVIDDFRIRAALPTIQYCLNEGSKVILISHLGRPNGIIDPKLSLMPAGEKLADLLEMPIKFSNNCISEDAHDVTLGLRSGEIHLLENLRFHTEETKNDQNFSINLAKHGQIFINDAFGTAHRSHASNVGVSKYFNQKCMGFLIEKELEFLDKSMSLPKKPLTLILGGAKIDTKIDLINRFIQIADQIIIGGGMAFTFLKAKGKDVGTSLIDPSMIPEAKKILANARGKTNLIFPKDFICAKSMNHKKQLICNSNEIPSDLMGLDIGPSSIDEFSKIIRNSGTVLWNGPMGVFEVDGFHLGTEKIAESISNVTNEGSTTIVGGGDSAAAIKKFGMLNNFSHISTGGGATLSLLSGNTMPAIYALEL
ncbi:phosphoglycerate kinase [Candidatus Marinimicrobia bacterium]|nr:phosphoglycerate kinase [Candidatus Neomarinimicrobiota bacterium]